MLEKFQRERKGRAYNYRNLLHRLKLHLCIFMCCMARASILHECTLPNPLAPSSVWAGVIFTRSSILTSKLTLEFFTILLSLLEPFLFYPDLIVISYNTYLIIACTHYYLHSPSLDSQNCVDCNLMVLIH